LRQRALIGNALDEDVLGFSTDDVLRGGGGNDTLRGGAGNDSYQFGVGSSNDVVVEHRGVNRIVLVAGITPANLQLVRTSSRDYLNGTAATSDALVIILNGSHDQLRIENFFDGAQ